MKKEKEYLLHKKILSGRYPHQNELLTLKLKLLEKLYNFDRNQQISNFNDYEKQRWDRQTRNFTIDQEKIKNSKIGVFGCGGIGSNVLLGLSYSGIENFKIVDFDTIELSNLNRQTLYLESDLNQNKVQIAAEKLKKINHQTKVEYLNQKIRYLPTENVFDNNLQNDEKIKKVEKIIDWADIVVCAVDYFGAPYLINDLCVKYDKAFYWAGVNFMFGDIFRYKPNKESGCFRCIYSKKEFISNYPFLRYKRPSGIKQRSANLGTTVITLGNLIAEMIIHDICEIAVSPKSTYYIYDSLDLKIFKIEIRKNDNCIC